MQEQEVTFRDKVLTLVLLAGLVLYTFADPAKAAAPHEMVSSNLEEVVLPLPVLGPMGRVSSFLQEDVLDLFNIFKQIEMMDGLARPLLDCNAGATDCSVKGVLVEWIFEIISP